MMKKLFSILLVSLMLIMSICPVFCFADDNLDESYYRANDTCKDEKYALTQEEQRSLDEDCLEFAANFKVDMSFLSIGNDYIDGTVEQFAKKYYDDSKFGYGSSKSGFQVIYNYDADKVFIYEYGDAKGLITNDYKVYTAQEAPGYREQYGDWGVLYSVFKMINDQLTEDEPAPVSVEPINAENGELKRVVDKACIFTDAEIAQMESRIAEIGAELGRDIVIYTDISCHGKERKIAAADFYDDNGYGYGPDYEGVCLFICMDPNDRGWWCCCTGPDTMGLYTEEYANDIDDVLYDYMVAGTYGAGVINWIENIYSLYKKGVPFAPAWLPDRGETYVRTNLDYVPRVVDYTGILTASQIEDLTERAKAISDKYNLDVVINVTDSSCGMGRTEYMSKFYYYNGYGYGSTYNGILITFFTKSGYCMVYPEGTGYEKLTETNQDRITSQCNCENGDVYSSAVKFLQKYDKMRKTGRVAQGPVYWFFTTVLGLGAGSVVGGAGVGKARRKMRTVAMAYGASDYIVPGSVRCENIGDRFTHTTTSRRYDPVVEKESHSSGGGGRSSYSSSYHSSSGRSHSGSGRNF